MKKLIIVGLVTIVSLSSFAQEINLPPANRTGGKPLMDALNERQSAREFSDKELSMQTLSDLLWAAWGFNREDRRTAPSSANRQEIDLYVTLNNGIYFYDAKNQKLIMKVPGNHQAKTGTQPFVGSAPLNILIVANLDRASSRDAALMDSGFISQNIYLYCASEGLNNVVRGLFNKSELHSLLGLSENQEVILTHSVGYKP